jgi:hypothetical protein
VALLVFEDVKGSPLADLLDASQRQKTASELNAAILSSQSQVGGRAPWWWQLWACAAPPFQGSGLRASLQHTTTCNLDLQGLVVISRGGKTLWQLSLISSPPSAQTLCLDHLLDPGPQPGPHPQERESRLPNLLKLLVWVQQQLDEKAVYPRINDLATAELIPPPSDD